LAFAYCKSLMRITVDVQNQAYSSIQGVLFNKNNTILIQYPTGKQGAYTIPAGVISIGKRAFIKCASLTSVTIPASVISIGEAAFYWCTGLTNIIIPSSITSIGRTAFYDCPLPAAIREDMRKRFGHEIFAFTYGAGK